MRHDIHLDGYAFRLRPIRDADAQFVLDLRGDPELARFIHSTPPRLSDQLAWLAAYYERAGDYYFVVERRLGQQAGHAEGLISIYDIDETARAAEWGRWVLRRGSLAAPESAWLMYRCAFEQLQLSSVYSRTVADNLRVVSFHDSCGITRRHRLQAFFELQGSRFDAIQHDVDRESWPEIAPNLERPARALARKIERG
jgi:RimJ/RimL family protein N-acetyltransferase